MVTLIRIFPASKNLPSGVHEVLLEDLGADLEALKFRLRPV